MSATRACCSSVIPSPTSVTGAPTSTGPGRTTAIASIETAPTTRQRSPATSTSVPVRSRRNPSAYPTGTMAIQVSSCATEDTAVAGRIARREAADLRDVGLPAERRPQVEPARLLAERIDPVERDAAAGGVEPGLGEQQRGGAVRDVAREDAGVRLGRPEEALELLVGEVAVGVGGGEMGHQPDDGRAGHGQLGEPPAPHPGVELEVDLHTVGQRPVVHGELERGVARHAGRPRAVSARARRSGRRAAPCGAAAPRRPSRRTARPPPPRAPRARRRGRRARSRPPSRPPTARCARGGRAARGRCAGSRRGRW